MKRISVTNGSKEEKTRRTWPDFGLFCQVKYNTSTAEGLTPYLRRLSCCRPMSRFKHVFIFRQIQRCYEISDGGSKG